MEPQAQLYYNILEAMFDYADENIEPKGLGLMSHEKELTMLEQAGMFELAAEQRAIPYDMVAKSYQWEGCQFHMIPPYDANTSPYEFREPTQPATTKAGWIKAGVMNMIGDNAELEYGISKNYVTYLNLKIKDPNDRVRFGEDRYIPSKFPEMSVAVSYAKSLARALGLKKRDPVPTPEQQNMLRQQEENELLAQIERDNMNNALIQQQFMSNMMQQQAFAATMAAQNSAAAAFNSAMAAQSGRNCLNYIR